MPDTDTRARSIVFLVYDYLPARGGTTTQTRLQALEFRNRGWDVTVLTRRVRGRLNSEYLDGIRVRRLALPGRGPAAKLVDVVLAWIWLVRRRRTLDAVSVMMDADYAMAACAAGLRDETVLTWVTRGDATRLLGGHLGAFRRRLIHGVRHVVLTPRMADELERLGVEDAEVIPVPVDSVRFHPPSPRQKSEAVHDLKIEGGPVVLFVGHLQERKGIDLLIQAFSGVLDVVPDAHLVIVGGPIESVDHHYVARLDQIIIENGIEDAVVMVGAHDDVVPYMFAADIFCLPSHREGMPNVLLEAMACGVACIAPATAGGDELLYGSAGVIPDSNSPADIREAIVSLLADPDRRRSLTGAALARVRADNRPDMIAAAYERLWDPAI